jgi:hypothetical protein
MGAQGGRVRWLRFGAALIAAAALVVYGLRQPAPRLLTFGSVRAHPDRYAGQEFTVEMVRVVDVLPGGFVGDIGGRRVVFRGDVDVSPGQTLSARVVFDPGSGELRLKDALRLPRGMSVLRGVIFGVSAVVMLVVAGTVVRRFRWSPGAGLDRREGGAAWRTF